MFIPDPDFYWSRISDQTTATKGGGKFVCSNKYHNIESYFSFEPVQKFFSRQFTKIVVLFTQKIVTKLWKSWVWHPGSRKKKTIQDPRVKKAPDPGSATPLTSNPSPPPPQSRKEDEVVIFLQTHRKGKINFLFVCQNWVLDVNKISPPDPLSSHVLVHDRAALLDKAEGGANVR